MENLWLESPENYVDLEDESRKFHLHPWLRERISGLKPKRILDFGCGDGSLFVGFEERYESLLLYDQSKKMLALAQENLGDDQRIQFSSDSKEIEQGAFDLVVCSLVLMTIESQGELENALAKMFDACSSGAHCIIAVTHPCFRQYVFSTFKTEFADRPFFYMKEGIPFRVTLTNAIGNRSIEFTDYHWSLSCTVNLLLNCKFQLGQVVELPDHSAIQESSNSCFPGYLVLECCKP